MASTCSQVLDAIRLRIEAISIPDADRRDSSDVFQGVIGALDGQSTDRCFALQPGIPERSTRYTVTPQVHAVDVVLIVGYFLTQDAWVRAADDASLITEALWSCVSGSDLTELHLGAGQIRQHGTNALVAERQLTIEWRRAD
jgi:hypothetical protein